MKKLPLGIKSIEVLLTNDYLYIDKTEYYKMLIEEGKYFFISRPKRFGKSLLISTLKEIFEGNKELFKEQYIYKKHIFKKHPIIQLILMKFNTIEMLKSLKMN